MKGLAIVGDFQTEDVLIERLERAGLEIQLVSNGAYNVISKATGAVMERLVGRDELAKYGRCMDYVASRHGRDINERFAYVTPVHR